VHTSGTPSSRATNASSLRLRRARAFRRNPAQLVIALTARDDSHSERSGWVVIRQSARTDSGTIAGTAGAPATEQTRGHDPRRGGA
jgi:hypothetical protein